MCNHIWRADKRKRGTGVGLLQGKRATQGSARHQGRVGARDQRIECNYGIEAVQSIRPALGAAGAHRVFCTMVLRLLLMMTALSLPRCK